ncbi:MAG: hypothetical protein ABEJ74_07155 [Haloferacaceae archaeon]
MRGREAATVRFASDSRGRVPFALIAVILLLGSSAFATTLSVRDGATVDADVDAALDRTTAATRPALRTAVAAAARDAARRPVVRRANTTYGRVLNASTPFRDALRVRIYVGARDRLPATSYRRRDVTAVASLPPTPNASALRAAKRRVRIEAIDGGRSLRVTVPVTLTARRAGEAGSTRSPIVRERERFSVTVATPVLLAHARTERFERRLNRGPLKSGLGQQVTGRLYPIAWARGAAQYGGAPVENVVTTRHVALAANGGTLAVQRGSFGRTDPEALDAYGRATVRTGLRDVLAVAPRPDAGVAAATLPPPNLPPVGAEGSGNDGSPTGAPDGARDWNAGGPRPRGVPGESLRARVNGSADEAFLYLVSGDPTTASATRPERDQSGSHPSTSGGGPGPPRRLGAVVGEQYRAEFRLHTDVERVEVHSEPGRRPAGGNWTLEATHRSKSVDVDAIDGGPVGAVDDGPVGAVDSAPRGAVDGSQASDGAARTFDAFARSVTVRTTTTRVWTNGTGISRSTSTRTTVYRVEATLTGRHDPAGPPIPEGPTRPVFRPGGAFDGRNLGPAVAGGRERLIADQHGRDGVARSAVLGGLDRRATVTVSPPDGVEAWILADLGPLRERVRNVSIRVARDGLASGTANPSARLASTLRRRRESLVDAPAGYDGVADRARVAARRAYVDAVIRVLSERAARRRAGNDRLARVFERAGVGSPSDVRAVSRARDRARTGARRTWGDPDGPGGAVALVPDGEPAYLTLAAVDRERVPVLADGERYHPLATRNLNLFTVPYGDAVDVVAGEPEPATDCEATRGRPVRLRTAGRVLTAAERAPPDRTSGRLRARRERLAGATRGALEGVRARAVEALTRPKPGGVPALSTADAEAAVDAGFARWDSPGDRAVAASNGSLAAAIATAAAARTGLSPARRDLLATFLRVELRRVVAESRVPYGTVNRTTTSVRAAVHGALKRRAKSAAGNLTEQAAEEALGPEFEGIPAGLPLLPAPGYWVATVNVWRVQVRGAYARFTVHARAGATGRGLSYVRERETVALDVDDDGEDERLGSNARIDFETGTVVVMAVPPSGRGVGDVDGNADERSAGWGAREGNGSEPEKGGEQGCSG